MRVERRLLAWQGRLDLVKLVSCSLLQLLKGAVLIGAVSRCRCRCSQLIVFLGVCGLQLLRLSLKLIIGLVLGLNIGKVQLDGRIFMNKALHAKFVKNLYLLDCILGFLFPCLIVGIFILALLFMFLLLFLLFLFLQCVLFFLLIVRLSTMVLSQVSYSKEQRRIGC